ncbi:unnamed protein product [Trifolium pratense]|uniref:Uncharacterized protein n=1 Tax=Trifolium pratense TaxID=57577 RepID=A0ACB0K1R6_TRIPR|nr:unnamed protein product [Trifolium pratense]
MEDLKRQRDLAQCQLDLERRANKVQKGSIDCGSSSQVVRCLSFADENELDIVKHTPERRVTVSRQAMLKNLLASPDPSILVDEIQKLEHWQLQVVEDANRALEVLHKDFATHNLNQQTADTMSKVLSEIKDLVAASSTADEIVKADKTNLMEKITQLKNQGNTISSLERKLANVQKSIDKLVSAFGGTKETPDCKTQPRRKKILSLNNSPGCIKIPHKRMMKVALLRQSKSVNVKKVQKMFKNAFEENIRSFGVYITELKELVAKLHYQKQLLVCQVLELEANKSVPEEMDTIDRSPLSWCILFEQQRKQIIMLWHLCHISLVHRTQFYLLLRGDPSDQVYMEVELRRLTWLEQHLAELGNASPALLSNEPADLVSGRQRWVSLWCISQTYAPCISLLPTPQHNQTRPSPTPVSQN